ncbi:MAG: HNH endonuclease [Nanoarchaeota archaeon]
MICFKQTKLLNYLEPRLGYNQGKVFSIAKWRKGVLARDKNKCRNCFNAITDVYRHRNPSNEAHHIIARHHGGKNALNNGITLQQFYQVAVLLPPMTMNY